MSAHPVTPVLPGGVAVVTGGARGIGAACAARLAAAGARVAVLDLSAAEPMPPHDHFSPCDVSDEACVEAAFDAVRRALGPADILVNAAGITVRSRAVDMRAADFERVTGVNLTGTFLCCREAARQMADRGGAIVNVASIMGFSGGLFPNGPTTPARAAP